MSEARSGADIHAGLLLVGAGHAHLHVIERLQTETWTGGSVVVLNPSPYQYYSGMFSGYVEGRYALDDIRIHLPRLIQPVGCWIRGKAVDVDAKRQVVYTENDQRIHYRLLSFNIGSLTARSEIPGVRRHAWTLKPNADVPDRVERMRKADHPVIVGGGAAGTELSLSLQAWRRDSLSPVTLISERQPLESFGSKAATKARRILKTKGVRGLVQTVTAVKPRMVVLADGHNEPFDHVLWLAGPAPHDLFRQSGLDVDDQGWLRVQDTLQSKRYPHIFGAGDCVTLECYPGLSKSGVHAVRQAKTLWENLKRYVNGEALVSFRPPSRVLSILSTGDRQGLMIYGRHVYHGRWAWKWKNRIDTRFIAQYQKRKDV